jgi:hypothetical protein
MKATPTTDTSTAIKTLMGVLMPTDEPPTATLDVDAAAAVVSEEFLSDEVGVESIPKLKLLY